jgi:hypothetical protein
MSVLNSHDLSILSYINKFGIYRTFQIIDCHMIKIMLEVRYKIILKKVINELLEHYNSQGDK